MNDIKLSTISREKAQKLDSRIRQNHAKIEKGYIDIVGDVAQLNDTKAYRYYDYSSIVEMCAAEYGMSKSTVYNLLSINARFCDNYKLTNAAKEMSMRDMLSVIADEKKKALEEKGVADGGKARKKTSVIAMREFKHSEFDAITEWMAATRKEYGDVRKISIAFFT